MTFNGITKPYLKVLRGRRRPPFAPIKRNILTIPGMPGGYLQDTQTDVRTITVPVLIKGANFSDLQKLKEDLASWLVTDQPEELIFPDEPDRLYYAVVDNTLDLDEIAYHGQGTITFLCPDPYKYSAYEKVATFTNTGVINVEGTAPAEPRIKVTVSKDTTFVAAGNGDVVNMVGMPANIDQQAVPRQERKLWHQMDTLNGWSDTTVVEGGINAGTMKTNGYAFYSNDFGIGSAWHGPAKKIGIGASLQDFQIDALIRASGANGQVGCVEIAFLDANNTFVGKMYMIKRSANNQANWAVFIAGKIGNNKTIMDQRGAADSVWATFDGMLRIARVGNVWSCYVAQIDSKNRHSARAGATWTDIKGIATAPITQVQVQLWQYGTTPVNTLWIDDIKVFKINSLADTQIPIIASAGDVIEFDHVSDIIRKNGEDFTKYKALIGEYFILKPGANAIAVEPADSISNVEVRWRDKWL